MILSDLPITEYHSSVPQWLSKTSLKHFIEYGPKWWRLAYLERTIPIPEPGGAAQGLALDCWLTEGPEAFARQWAIKPEGMKLSTKEGRAWGDEQVGKRILSHEDFSILLDAVAAVTNCPAWSDIEKARAQHTIRRQSSSLGLGLQSRPDWLHRDGSVLWDLKKTNDLKKFGGQAIELGYHLQASIAGWCLADDGISLDAAYLVAVEWERGARCRVYEIPDACLAAGDDLMRRTAAEIADRLKRNDWTDKAEVSSLVVPEWVMRKSEVAA